MAVLGYLWHRAVGCVDYLGPVAPLGFPAGGMCLVLGAALGLVTVNMSKVRLGGWSRYHLCFPTLSTDLTDVVLDPQNFFSGLWQ